MNTVEVMKEIREAVEAHYQNKVNNVPPGQEVATFYKYMEEHNTIDNFLDSVEWLMAWEDRE